MSLKISIIEENFPNLPSFLRFVFLYAERILADLFILNMQTIRQVVNSQRP